MIALSIYSSKREMILILLIKSCVHIFYSFVNLKIIFQNSFFRFWNEFIFNKLLMYIMKSAKHCDVTSVTRDHNHVIS